jgi:hypothetical protein
MSNGKKFSARIDNYFKDFSAVWLKNFGRWKKILQYLKYPWDANSFCNDLS